MGAINGIFTSLLAPSTSSVLVSYIQTISTNYMLGLIFPSSSADVSEQPIFLCIRACQGSVLAAQSKMVVCHKHVSNKSDKKKNKHFPIVSFKLLQMKYRDPNKSFIFLNRFLERILHGTYCPLSFLHRGLDHGSLAFKTAANWQFPTENMGVRQWLCNNYPTKKMAFSSVC